MSKEIFVRMALDAWNVYIKRTDDLLKQLSDDQLAQAVAPGRNSGKYLLGHLVAVHDRMLPLLNLGEAKYPQLGEPFLVKPDGEQTKAFSIEELRKYWKETNDRLNSQMQKLTPDQWFEKHTSVSEEDFKKEPHRNKLNIIINRTNHLAGHYEQLVFLKPKAS